jgi:hypothetical protein
MKVAFLSVDGTKVADILAQILVAMLRNIVLVSDAIKTRRNTQTFLWYFVGNAELSMVFRMKRRAFYAIS